MSPISRIQKAIVYISAAVIVGFVVYVTFFRTSGPTPAPEIAPTIKPGPLPTYPDYDGKA